MSAPMVFRSSTGSFFNQVSHRLVFRPGGEESNGKRTGRHWHESHVSEMIHASSRCSLILRAQGAHWPEGISRAFHALGSQPGQCKVFVFVKPAKGMPPHGRCCELGVIRRLVRDDHHRRDVSLPNGSAIIRRLGRSGSGLTECLDWNSHFINESIRR